MVIVRSGRWLYDGAVPTSVDVIGLDHDFWFAIAEAEGQLSPGETPSVPGESGLLYYVRFRHAGSDEPPTWPDSGGYQTLEEAVRAAEERAPGRIWWDDLRAPSGGAHRRKGASRADAADRRTGAS